MRPSWLYRIDLRSLRALQHDGRIGKRRLSEQVALSPPPCWRVGSGSRRTATDILGDRARLDPARLARARVVFVEVLLDRTALNVLGEFKAAVQVHEAILDGYLAAGGFDRLLKTRMADMAADRAFAGEALWRLPGVRETRTRAVMGEVKRDGTPPLG